MKYWFTFFLTIFVIQAFAQTAPPAPTPLASPTPPEIEARAYLLLDLTAGGQVLASKSADQPVEPASLTKLMTAYLAFDALKHKKNLPRSTTTC